MKSVTSITVWVFAGLPLISNGVKYSFCVAPKSGDVSRSEMLRNAGDFAKKLSERLEQFFAARYVEKSLSIQLMVWGVRFSG